MFRDFVAVIIAAHGSEGSTRYLSKNNNNVLRLKGLARALPASHIIVPFRTPLQHARSLLRQHNNFCKAQEIDPFIRKYISWLGHFEFGRDYRPFRFGDEQQETNGDVADHIDHWLKCWTRVYQGVLATLPDNAILWGFDAFCADPKRMISGLAEYLDLDVDFLRSAVSEINQAPSHAETDDITPAILAEAQSAYSELTSRAATKLG